MSICFENNRFHLKTRRYSYIFELTAGRYPVHLYWGRKVRDINDHPLSRLTRYDDKSFTLNEQTLDHLPLECPVFGGSDLRPGMLHLLHADGTHALDLVYKTHEILDGSKVIQGLPSARGDDAQTLVVTLEDRVSGIKADLFYTVWQDLDVIARHLRIRNEGTAHAMIEEAMSASVDFENADMDLLTLSGSWAREREPFRRSLVPGIQAVSTERGASSHQTSPFIALMSKNATERSGDVYGFALCYSGSFYAGVNVDQFGMARTMMGINPYNFAWKLQPGDAFETPECYLVYSDTGIGGMSRIYHRFIHERITSGRFASGPRPILINNWEATYFNFNEDKLLELARCAKDVGIDLFVLDDGWFGHRDSDNSSLGDWTDDLNKLPGGLRHLSDSIHELGLKFGLWVEPEMISPDSDLYRAHPDWCIHVGSRQRLESRQQLVLDLTRSDVREYIVSAISSAINRANADYIKWDMNRNISMWGASQLPADQQQELGHRYILGLYEIVDRITKAFPAILFESCSGGGGRFDLGMLTFMPQTWCSDDTDAWMRCRIESSTSLLFPPSAMGAHVSAVPNHQTGRNTPLQTRAAVAMCGTFGYELDLLKLTPEELDEIRTINTRVHAWQMLLYYGNFYRLCDPYNSNEAGWMVVSDDRSEAIVTHVYAMAYPNQKQRMLLLDGLDPDLHYLDDATGRIYGGDELMYHGYPLKTAWNDYMSQQIHLTAVK
ncbi:MAG: alpha-galactosidase [Clostridia bacterium]|nr:alpha-galactosidase [Clostridia bacterium]